MVMYMCSRAHQLGVKNIELKYIFDDVNIMSYCCGFLVASTSAGLLRTSIDLHEKQVKVFDCDKLTTETINHWLETNKLDEMPPIKRLKDRIDEYFGAKEIECAK